MNTASATLPDWTSRVFHRCILMAVTLFSIGIASTSAREPAVASTPPSKISAVGQTTSASAIGFVHRAYWIIEAETNVVIQVQRTGALSSGARVDYMTEDGTAASGKDYQAQSGTLHFAPGESLQTLRIPILDDGYLEEAESLTMKLSNPGAESSLANATTATITIRDNELVPPVSPDPNFSGTSILETPPPNSGVERLVVQPDGKILVAGGMVGSADTNRAALVRLNADGTLDAAFKPLIEFWENGSRRLASCNQAALLPSGRVMVSGRFSSVNGVARPGLARLEADGSLDATFDPGAGAGFLLDFAFQADEKVMIAGAFDVVQGVSRRAVARLESDGKVDATFQPSLAGDVYVTAIALQPDGRVVLATGQNSSGIGKNLVRLDARGALDPSFDIRGGVVNRFKAGWVEAIEMLPDGKLLIAGAFTSVDGFPRRGLARLLSDGSVDPAFIPEGIPLDQEGTAWVTVLAVQADGKPLISWYPMGTPTATLARLNANGSVDASFSPMPGLQPCPQCFGQIRAVALQANGLILVGGILQRLNSNGSLVTGVGRFNPRPMSAFELAPGDVTVGEATGEFAITVRRLGDTLEAASVSYIIADGTARAGEDYVKETSTLTFEALQTTKLLRLRIVDNQIQEPDETFKVTLTRASAGTVLAPTSSVTIKIQDDDLRRTSFEFAAEQYAVNELDGGVRIAILRSGDLTVPARVNYALGSLRTATPGTDLGEGFGTAYFGSGQSEVSLWVPVFEDAVAEGDEGVIFVLRDAVAEGGVIAQIGARSTTHLRIENAGNAVEFSTPDLSAYESSPEVPVMVQRRGETDREFTVAYSSRELSARSGLDYTAPSGTLTFAPGQMTNKFFIVLSNNFAVDGTRQFELRLEPQSGEVLLTRRATVTFNILDDEHPAAVDPTFITPLLPDSRVDAMLVQSDGKIVLGGDLVIAPNRERKVLARLQADGALDATFQEGAADGKRFARVQALALAGDGLLVAGLHGSNTFVNVHRLHLDGRLDPLFRGGLGAQFPYLSIAGLVIQPHDGRILVLGEHLIGVPQTWQWPGLTRLNSDGTLDPSFRPGLGALLSYPRQRFADVRAAAVQSDGRIIIGGRFTEYDGVPRASIARIHPDGSLDRTFDSGAGIPLERSDSTGTVAAITSLVIQDDGRMIASGSFDRADGSERNLMARWNPDGSLDGTFDLLLRGSGVRVLTQGQDGSMIAGGTFSSPRGSSGVARVTRDATLDPTLRASVWGSTAIGLQPDGRLIVATGSSSDGVGPVIRLFSDSTSRRGMAWGQSVVQVEERGPQPSLSVVRLGNSAEPLNVGYATHEGTAREGMDYVSMRSVVTLGPGENMKDVPLGILDDGEVERAESFGVALSDPSGNVMIGMPALARVVIRDNEIPALVDSSLDVDLDGRVSATLRQPGDDAIVIAGAFRRVNGVERPGIARLLSDGSLDLSFEPPSELKFECCSSAMALQADGKLLIAGSFSDTNQVNRTALIRLGTNGAIDRTFSTPMDLEDFPNAIAVDGQGRILLAMGGSIRRWLEDGTLDTTFAGEQGFNGVVSLIVPGGDGTLLVAGAFTEYRGISRRLAARLLEDGRLDERYVPAVPAPEPGLSYDSVRAIQSDGKVIVLGSQADAALVTRLDADGSMDPTFVIDGAVVSEEGRLEPWILAATHMADGTLVMAAPLSVSVDDSYRHPLVVVRTDGTVRLGPDLRLNWGDTRSFLGLLDVGRGQVLARGSFVGIAGGPHRFLARIHLDMEGVTSCEWIQREFRVGESEGHATVRLRRIGDVSATTTVHVRTEGGSAVSGRDYEPVNLTVTFGPLETEKTVSITVHGDDEADVNRSVELRLDNPSGTMRLGRTRASLVIVDDDRPGSLDFNFHPTIENGNLLYPSLAGVERIRALADGGFQVWGGFTHVEGAERPGFAQFDRNGKLDHRITNFMPVVLADGSEGRTYGYAGNAFVRFHPNGSVDPAFHVVESPMGSVQAVAELPDGYVLVGGLFEFMRGTPWRGLARLNQDGGLDQSWRIQDTIQGVPSQPTRPIITSILSQPDGGILLGGYFASAQGMALARLRADGSLDPGFGAAESHEARGEASIMALGVREDGAILALGAFPRLTSDASWRNMVVRFNPNGQYEAVVVPPDAVRVVSDDCGQCEGYLNTMEVLPGGALLLGGYFTHFDGMARTGLAMLRGDAPTRPVMESVRITAGAFLEWIVRGQTGWTYRVEISTDLVNWLPLREVPSQGQITVMSDEALQQTSQAYYRIRAEP